MDKKDLEIGEHCLVPEHRKLSEDEKAEILKKYNVTEKELPRMLKKDPAIKKLDVEVGDVIEIKRTISTTKENYFYYRAVI